MRETSESFINSEELTIIRVRLREAVKILTPISSLYYLPSSNGGLGYPGECSHKGMLALLEKLVTCGAVSIAIKLYDGC